MAVAENNEPVILSLCDETRKCRYVRGFTTVKDLIRYLFIGFPGTGDHFLTPGGEADINIWDISKSTQLFYFPDQASALKALPRLNHAS
jgi:hypothetical protein